MARPRALPPSASISPEGLTSTARRVAWRAYRASEDVSLAEAAEVAGISRQSLSETARDHQWAACRQAYLASFTDPESLPGLVLSVLASAGRRSVALSEMLDARLQGIGPAPTLEQIEAISKTHDRLTRLSLDLLSRLVGPAS